MTGSSTSSLSLPEGHERQAGPTGRVSGRSRAHPPSRRQRELALSFPLAQASNSYNSYFTTSGSLFLPSLYPPRSISTTSTHFVLTHPISSSATSLLSLFLLSPSTTTSIQQLYLHHTTLSLSKPNRQQRHRRPSISSTTLRSSESPVLPGRDASREIAGHLREEEGNERLCVQMFGVGGSWGWRGRKEGG